MNKLVKNTILHNRDSIFTTKYGFLKLHLSRGPQYVLYTNDYCFVSYGCPPPKMLSH